MNLETLRKAIESGNIDEAKSLLQEVGRNKYENAIPLLLEFLRKTDDNRLRNSIAIALSDIGNERVVEPIVEMINNTKTLGNRGSLLYALEPFDCSLHLETLVKHLVTGNFEVQMNSYQLIEENIHSSISDEVLLNCIFNVKKKLDEIERQKGILSDALELLISFKRT